MKDDILYGIHPVTEALKAGRRRTRAILTAMPSGSSSRIRGILQMAEDRKIPVQTVPESRLTALAGAENHQGVAAQVSPFPFSSLEEILSPRVKTGSHPFVLMLDSLTDPQNLGAIFRTALCAGVDGVVLPKDRSGLPTPLVSRISAGAMEHVRIARVVNLVSAIRDLKQAGIWVAGLDRDAGLTIYQADWSVPIAVVIGAEGKGIRDLVRLRCDFLVSIPHAVSFDSLNASVAGAVVMYEILRQRRWI
jgi:23S rRNA (guanosine2251-2'-O)-methyltransferase